MEKGGISARIPKQNLRRISSAILLEAPGEFREDCGEIGGRNLVEIKSRYWIKHGYPSEFLKEFMGLLQKAFLEEPQQE